MRSVIMRFVSQWQWGSHWLGTSSPQRIQRT